MFRGGVNIARGFSINLGADALVQLGEGFNSNFGLIISCANKIEFGNRCLLGWNCTFIDSDGHKIFQNDAIINPTNTVCIGNHVWISANSTFLKGTNVSHDSIVGMGSLVTKCFDASNVIIAGNPAKIVKREINWEK